MTPPPGNEFRKRDARLRATMLRCRADIYPPGDENLDETTVVDTAYSGPVLDIAAALVITPPRSDTEAKDQVRKPQTEGACFAEVLPVCGEEILRALARSWGPHTRRWPDLVTIGQVRAALAAAGFTTNPIPPPDGGPPAPAGSLRNGRDSRTIRSAPPGGRSGDAAPVVPERHSGR